MSRAAALALLAYPPSFRERYGDELAALVDDLPSSARSTADLFRGAARAWLSPQLAGSTLRQRRVQASLTTTWAAWCLGFLVAPTVNRALLDPPTAGASGSVRTLLQAGYVLFFVGWGLAAVGALPLAFRVLWPALRSRSWPALRPLVPALVLGPMEALGLVWLSLAVNAHPGVSYHATGWQLLGAALWLVGFAGFIVSLALGPAMTLSRLGLPNRSWRLPMLLSVPLALTLTALTAASLAAAVVAGDANMRGSGFAVTAAIAVAALASLTSLVSAARGCDAMRRWGRD